jgi:DHA1 family bicyclomycin/chloramphenicol resistance-like MFS transporter
MILSLWLGLRQPETHPPEARRPLRPRVLWAGFVEVLSNRNTGLSIAVQALCFGMLFGLLASTQQIFDITFDKATSFPLWFGLVALIASTASILNATLVERLGMHFLIRWTISAQILLSGVSAMLWSFGWIEGAALFTLFMIWKTSVFFQAGLTIGNINAIAMTPMGHIAGVASSVIGSVATIVGAGVAIPLGLAFDGTPVPLMIGICVLAALARMLMAALPRTSDLS